MINGFKDFILRGNVIDLAVAVDSLVPMSQSCNLLGERKLG